MPEEPDEPDSDAGYATAEDASATVQSESVADDLDESLDPSTHEPDPSFDVTSGDDLVEQLPSGSEVPTEVRRDFWTTAFLLKIAILSLTGAALFAYFRGDLLAAGVLGAVGLLAGSRTLLKIQQFRQS